MTYPPNTTDLSNISTCDLCYLIIVVCLLLLAFLVGNLHSDRRMEKKLEKLVEIDHQNHKTR